MRKIVFNTIVILTLIFGLHISTAYGQEQNNSKASKENTVKKTSHLKSTKSDLAGTELSLDKQFDFVISKSGAYKSFKIIKLASIKVLKNNSLDSVQIYKDKIKSLENINAEQNKKSSQLKETLQKTKDNLNMSVKKRDSLSFLGISMQKGMYSTVIWVIIFILIIAIAILIFIFKRSHYITSKVKESLSDKQEELDKHRKWALEREQSLSRELNKLKLKYKGFDQ